MTRQLDPTILRFFTVSRIISPASEMCLCKFHIEIEYFLTRRHPPCAQTLSALRFLPRHWPITHQTHHYNPHFSTIIHYATHAFSKASFSRPRISASAFLAIPRHPQNPPKASLVPYVPNHILLCVFHYGEVVPELSSAAHICLVSYTFLSIYTYVYVLSDFLRFSSNVPFIVSYFFIWCFGYPHSRIPYMAWVGFRTAFTDGTGIMKCNFIEETLESKHMAISLISVSVL